MPHKAKADKEKSFAHWVVDQRGVRGLWHVINFVVLWSAAMAGDALDSVQRSGDVHSGYVRAVSDFGVRTHWGSHAKFYRELKYWRELTGTSDPMALLAYVPDGLGEADVLGRLWSVRASLVVAA